jgi:hypothetical protein
LPYLTFFERANPQATPTRDARPQAQSGDELHAAP